MFVSLPGLKAFLLCVGEKGGLALGVGSRDGKRIESSPGSQAADLNDGTGSRAFKVPCGRTVS